MKICGLISSKEEALEIQYMAKLLVLGNRIRKISKIARYQKTEKKMTASNLSG
jgi:hypothetical protein